MKIKEIKSMENSLTKDIAQAFQLVSPSEKKENTKLTSITQAILKVLSTFTLSKQDRDSNEQ